MNKEHTMSIMAMALLLSVLLGMFHLGMRYQDYKFTHHSYYTFLTNGKPVLLVTAQDGDGWEITLVDSDFTKINYNDF